MLSIDENLKIWDREYDWPQAGDEWSSAWGGARAQWFASILPRIANLLPAEHILEIAPGHGRWTQFLLRHCETMTLVDLSPKCIDACRKRFGGRTSLRYIVNDGRSLSQVGDETIDLAFSFDSLVHVEPSVLRDYLDQLARKLRPGGSAFIHHSNLGAYRAHLLAKRWIVRFSRGRSWLGDHLIHDCWRDQRTTAEMVRGYLTGTGLRCVSQEMVPWMSSVQPIDCFTVVRRDSGAQTPRVSVNHAFMKEAEIARAISRIYHYRDR
jgi:ubiquinone/menaquinone biosynthesis C-methylase UbiE